jgi:predicted MFS family arabinose efflux permease
VLTAAKLIANVALRWVGPFLPTLERAFGASTSTLTTIMGTAELGGLTTTVTGRALDRGHERIALVGGLGAVAASSCIALFGTTASFAVAFVVLVLGIANFTVAGHAWISNRVEYASRGRAVGIFETSWALALLLGAPVVALLIELVGWRGPFVLTAVGCAFAAFAVARRIPADHVPEVHADAPGDARFPASAWFPILGSALTAMAGLSIFVVSGAFLEDRHGASTALLGFVAALFGALELVASAGMAAFSDRIGKQRAAVAGLLLLLVGLGVVALSGGSIVLAVVGLTVFLTGFEFGFVSSLPLVSEAAPRARGRALGLGNSTGTLARSAGVLLSGLLYDRVGVGASLALSAAAATVAIGMLALTRVGP